MRGRTRPQLIDRRAFVQLTTCGAGLLWATPRIRSVAPAQAGTPAPTSTPPTTTSEPPEVASDTLVPPAPAVAAAPTSAASPEVHAKVTGVHDDLATTGTEVGHMTALGVGALVTGLGFRYAARRLEIDELELCPPDAGSPGAPPG